MSTVRARQYTIREAVVWTEIQDESVLLDLETGRYFELNAIGTEIWRMISRRADEDEIVHALLARFDVAPGRVYADLAEFLNALEARGLIQIDGFPRTG